MAFILVAGAAAHAGAEAPGAAALPAPLRAADQLMHTNPAQAAKVLRGAQAEPGVSTLAARRALLTRLIRAELDIGNSAGAKAARQALLDLGTQAHDPVSLALVKLYDINEHIQLYRSDAATEGLTALRETLDFAKAPDLAFAWHMAAGRTHLMRAEYDRAVEDFQTGVEIARRTEQPEAATVESYRNLGYAYMSMGDNANAIKMMAKGLDVPTDDVPARLLALLYDTHGNALVQGKRFAEAASAFARALRVCQQSGARSLEPRILNDWGNLALASGDFVGAERLTRRGLLVAQGGGVTGTTITLRANVGFALGGQGRVAEALPYIDAAIEEFRKLGDTHKLLDLIDEKGRMLERQGRLKETLTVLREQQALERAQFTEQRGKALAVLQERFESQQNRRQIELLQEQNKLKDADIRNRELRQLALGLVVLLMVAVGCMGGVLYRRARRTNAQLRLLNQQLAEHAVRDPLTGLYNRRSFVADMDARAAAPDVERRADARQAGAIMVLDLDHFKAVNDVHGHAAGDAVLVEVARRLQAAVRESDTVLRWGGEEFVIHLPSCSAEQAATIVRRVLDEVNGKPIDTGAVALNVSVSVGMVDLPFAGLPESACDWQCALRLADQALYLAKSGGRNRCNQLVPSRVPLAIDVAELEQDLDGALSAGHVVLQTVRPSTVAP